MRNWIAGGISLIILLGGQLTSAATFTGQGPGVSTIGIGGDYPSLSAACDAASSTPLTGGDWTFLILNDLAEASNSILTPPGDGNFKITIKPAPGTSSTVTFSHSSLNPHLMPGHFIIGARPTPGGWQVHPVRNVTVDGSSDDAGTSRNLTFKNLDIPNADSLIHVYGDCSHITIKNCGFEHNPRFHTREYGVLRAVEIMPGVDTVFDEVAKYIPHHCTVENNQFLIHDDYVVPAIACSRRGTPPGIVYDGPFNVVQPSVGMVIRNNIITSPYDGIHVSFSADIEISGNRLKLGGGGRGIQCDGTGTTTPSEARYVINGNWLDYAVDNSDSRLTGIYVVTGNTSGTAIVSNNMITGIGDWALPHASAQVRSAITSNADPLTTIIIAHNSLSLHAVDESTTALGQVVSGIHSYHRVNSTGKVIIKNNLVRVSTPAGYGLYFETDSGKPVPESDYNIIHAEPGSYIGLRTVGRPSTSHPTLPSWQTGTGFDLNSSSLDPMAGAITWAGPANSSNPDMHFTAFPGTQYLVPTIPEVTTDIDGEPRNPTATLAGADEVPEPGSSVQSWSLY